MTIINSTSATAPAPDGALTSSILNRADFTARAFGLPVIRPSAVWQGQIENPDEVLKQFGTWEGLAFYYRMMRQFAFLGGPINQRIDPVVGGIDTQIVAGDPDSYVSLQMAKDARRWFSDLPDLEIILRKLLLGQFVGFSPVEKVYGLHQATGLIAPVQLFDIPAQNIRFGPAGATYLRTERNWRGIPVPAHKLLIFRWGSNFTPYGEGELKDVYLATWYMQAILDAGLRALEQLGIPMPLVYVPKMMQPQERTDFLSAVKGSFEHFIEVPTDESRPSVELQGLSAAAGGNAGRSENEWLRYLENWIYVRLLNTAQTQDRGGSGNGKLEEQRASLKSDKTTQARAVLDRCLTEGLLNDVGALNWAHQPRELWPRCKSGFESTSQTGLAGLQLQQVSNTMLQLAAHQVTEIVAEKILVNAGIPRSDAAAMVQSTVAERDNLVAMPESAKAQPEQATAPTNQQTQEAA